MKKIFSNFPFSLQLQSLIRYISNFPKVKINKNSFDLVLSDAFIGRAKTFKTEMHFFIFCRKKEKNHSKRYGWVGWNWISWKANFIRKTNFCTFSIFSTNSYDVLHSLYYLVGLQEKHFLKNSLDFLSGLQLQLLFFWFLCNFFADISLSS
jgi:hypothetical protein